MNDDANQKSDYHYDVFISYSRNGNLEEYVKEHFYKTVKETLINELEVRKPNIFVDFDGIKYAQNYKAVLENALSRSVIFVPVIDALYFFSDWCRQEMCVAYEKQREIFDRDKDGCSSLIFPVIVKDYTDPPEKLEYIQNLDLKDSARIGRISGLGLYFSEEFEKWVKHIAEVLKKPPAWEEHWSREEWIDNAIEKHLEDMKLGPKSKTSPNVGQNDGQR